MKKIINILTATALATSVLTSCSTNSIKTNVTLTNEVDSASYAIGYIWGSQIRDNFPEANASDVLSGFMIAYNNDTINSKFENIQEAQMAFQTIMHGIEMKKQQEALKRNAEFLEENAKKEGVVSLPNGVQYIVLEEGQGEKPLVTDTVECDYIGTLIDGTEFDSSIKRGQPAKFPLNGVIRGWSETIPMMSLGSKWRLFIPSELGYGPREVPGIPANSILVFDVTLHQIIKGPKPENN